MNSKYLLFIAACSVHDAVSANNVCQKQKKIGSGLHNVEAGLFGPIHKQSKQLPGAVSTKEQPLGDQQQNLMRTFDDTSITVTKNGLAQSKSKKKAESSTLNDVAERQVCLKADVDPSPLLSAITLRNTTELLEKLEICAVKTTGDIPSNNNNSKIEKTVHYEDAEKELYRLLTLASQEAVPADLPRFINKLDFLDSYLMHLLIQSLGKTENGMSFTVPKILTIIENLAPIMQSGGISLHESDTFGKTPLQYLTHRILDENKPLSFESVKSIFDLIINLTSSDDENIKTAIGNLYIESITRNEKNQDLMNYIEQLIQKYSLDINYQSSTLGMKQTALHSAAKCDCETTVLKLLKMGVDPTIKDANGKTPRYFVDDGTNLDKILHIAEILHPIMGPSLTKLPMNAESMVALYRHYVQYHDGILHKVEQEPNKNSIKAELEKTWPFDSEDPSRHPYFEQWVNPSKDGHQDTPPIINAWLSILSDDLALRTINYFKFDHLPLCQSELNQKYSKMYGDDWRAAFLCH